MKVLHIITSLNVGGAQRMLGRIVKAQNQSGDTIEVVSLIETASDTIALSGNITGITRLRFDKLLHVPSSILKLRRLVKEFSPDVVQSWMYHADLLSSLFLPKRIPLIWNVRHSLHTLAAETFTLRLIIFLCARTLHSRPVKVVYNSIVSKKQHEALGYPIEKSVVIPNGFDTTQFCANETTRLLSREKLSLTRDTIVLGMAARYHPMKNHLGLLDAFAELRKEFDSIYLVLAGTRVDSNNVELMGTIEKLGIKQYVTLLGAVHDVPEFMNGLDVYILSSSWGEAFPNVLGEAMACQVPCVTTNVGDSAILVSDPGIIAESSRTDHLIVALRTMLSFSKEHRQMLGMKARQRICENYSMENIFQSYVTVYEESLEASYAK